LLTTWYTSLVDGAVRFDNDLEQPKNKIAGITSITEFIKVKHGEITFGKADRDRGLKDLPKHKATLTYDFFIGKYLITEETFAQFFLRDIEGESKIPVTSVSWYDAIEFCNNISQLNNLPVAYDKSGNLLDAYGRLTTDITQVIGYRLPTETEWVYVANGGLPMITFNFAGNNLLDYVGWYKDNSGGCLHTVAELQPNTLGIYDLSGNVNEWCYDSIDYGNPEFFKTTTNFIGGKNTFNKIVKGGSWNDPINHCSVNYRDFCSADRSYTVIGFRLARTII